jgi:hypothetical protein
MKFHGFVVGLAVASALILPAHAEDDVLDAAQLASTGQAAEVGAAPAGQLLPVVIDVPGIDAQGQPLTAETTLTPLPDGRVEVQQRIGDTLQTGVGTVQGNELRADLKPVHEQGGLTSVITDGPDSAPAQALPVVISVDPQSGVVQSRSPAHQGQASDRSHKVRDFFRSAGQKTKNFFVGAGQKTKSFFSNAGQKTKGLFARIGAWFKNTFAKLKARFSKKKAAPEAPAIAPTPITDLPALGSQRCPDPSISQLPPLSSLPAASELPALGEELPAQGQALPRRAAAQ